MIGEATIEILDTNNESQEYLGTINQSIYDWLAIPFESYRATLDQPVTVMNGEQLALRFLMTLELAGIEYSTSEEVTIVGNNRIWQNRPLYKEDKVNWTDEGF